MFLSKLQHTSSRQNPLPLSSCYYRLSLLGGVLCTSLTKVLPIVIFNHFDRNSYGNKQNLEFAYQTKVELDIPTLWYPSWVRLIETTDSWTITWVCPEIGFTGLPKIESFAMVFRDNCYINDLNFGAPYLETNPVAHRCPNGQHVLCDNCLEAEFSMREVTSCLRSKFRSLNLVSKPIRSYSMPHSKDSMVPRCPVRMWFIRF